MGQTLAEKIFNAHRVEMPFPDTHVLNWTECSVMRLPHRLP